MTKKMRKQREGIQYIYTDTEIGIEERGITRNERETERKSREKHA